MKKKKNVIKKKKFAIKPNACFKCGEFVPVLSNHLRMVTYLGGEVIEEVWFHLPFCWGEYNTQRFKEHLDETLATGMSSLKPLIEKQEW